MYLSRLQLNSHSRLIWQDVVDRPYKLHQLVMKAFPDGVTRAGANVLHRLEIDVGNAILLVQSEIKPNWDYIHHDLLPPASPFDLLPNPAIREINDLELEEGRILQFRLTANPTIKKVRRDKNGKRLNSNRVPLKREEKQLVWLQNKGKLHGFIIHYAQISHMQKQSSKKHNLTLFTVQFDGHLQIIDACKFSHAMKTGIGPAKAFGCGLLSIALAQ